MRARGRKLAAGAIERRAVVSQLHSKEALLLEEPAAVSTILIFRSKRARVGKAEVSHSLIVVPRALRSWRCLGSRCVARLGHPTAARRLRERPRLTR